MLARIASRPTNACTSTFVVNPPCLPNLNATCSSICTTCLSTSASCADSNCRPAINQSHLTEAAKTLATVKFLCFRTFFWNASVSAYPAASISNKEASDIAACVEPAWRPICLASCASLTRTWHWHRKRPSASRTASHMSRHVESLQHEHGQELPPCVQLSFHTKHLLGV